MDLEILSNQLFFGKGKKNVNADYQLLSNKEPHCNYFNYLIFVDSKGNANPDKANNSWVNRLCEYFDSKGYSVLAIVRPKEMTVFFTLINFLKSNQIKFDNLITNLGFVETTPKKEELIEDIILQCPFDKQKLSKFPICNYKLSSGETTTLYSINYGLLIPKIAKVLSENFEKIWLIGTFEFSEEIKIERKRPFEFYQQLPEANRLIKKIASYNTKFSFIDVNFDLPKGQNVVSYDAVHFTHIGHDIMFNIVKNRVKI